MHVELQPQGLALEDIFLNGILKILNLLRRTMPKEDEVGLLTCPKSAAYNDA